jgi:hypothetical protein
LDKTSDDYKKFVAFLDKVQDVSYKDANNNLDAILADTASNPIPSIKGANAFGVDLAEYPRVVIQPPRTIERVLNNRIST